MHSTFEVRERAEREGGRHAEFQKDLKISQDGDRGREGGRQYVIHDRFFLMVGRGRKAVDRRVVRQVLVASKVWRVR